MSLSTSALVSQGMSSLSTMRASSAARFCVIEQRVSSAASSFSSTASSCVIEHWKGTSGFGK
eukprot:11742088-Heterocapsa_arctica.AAC.1